MQVSWFYGFRFRVHGLVFEVQGSEQGLWIRYDSGGFRV